jgi:hypothetical protein
VYDFLFRFGGLPLYKVHFLILRNPLDISFARFTISSLKAFHKMSLHFLTPSSRGCSLLFIPSILLAVFRHVLRCGGSVTSRRLMPLLHSGPFLILAAANFFGDSRLS